MKSENDTLHGAFVARAREIPGAPAVYSGQGVLTYQELDEQSAALAEQLRTLGAGPGVCVGICVERGSHLVAGLLGILRSGACYVPLDPDYPPERLRFMVDDSKAGLLVTTPGSRAHCPAGPTVLVIADSIEIEPGSGSFVGVPEDSACLIFTSGSTGRPKGVPIRHSSCGALLDEMAKIFTGCDLSGVLAASSVCFDMSITEIFFTLAHGGALVLVESPLHLNESPYRDLVTQIHTIPSAMTALLRAGEMPPNLSTVLLGGEAVHRQLVDRIYAETNASKVFNGYGPTEATAFCTVKLVPRDGSREPTIGRPFSSAHVYVLDGKLRPVAPHQTGELYLGGPGLALGYHNQPGLTAERFLPDLYRAGERMYRTGDLAMSVADGEIEFVGRADHQVKVRGYRIELTEVEAGLSRCSEVSQAAVVARPTGEQDDLSRLVAYVVADAEATAVARPTVDTELRTRITRALRSMLPEYMIPEVMVFLPSLPLMPNGKLDRNALPDPPSVDEPVSTEAASTPTERALAEIWGNLLDLAPQNIGVRDSFYELGGNSLLLIRLAKRMRQKFARKVGVSDLFRFRDIASLAQWMDDQGEDVPQEVEQASRRGDARRTAVNNLRREPRIR